jgi:hypothetical protein
MSDLVSWVSLCDDEGHTQARYCPSYQILVIKRRGREYRFPLSEFNKAPDSQSGVNEFAIKANTHYNTVVDR